MSRLRKEDDPWDEINEELADDMLAREQAAFDKKYQEVNGLSFVWNGEKSSSHGSDVIEKAALLTQEKDFFIEYKTWGVFDWFYISDVPVGEGDSRNLSMKYGNDNELSFLQTGNTYFLNKI